MYVPAAVLLQRAALILSMIDKAGPRIAHGPDRGVQVRCSHFL